MGKYAKYTKHYKQEWEQLKEFKGWLQPVKSDPSKAYCKVCQKELRPHKTDLIKHANTLLHRHKISALNRNIQPSIASAVQVSQSNESKRRDIRLATFTACHSSIRAVDHLTPMLNKDYDLRSRNEELHLHRTKLTALLLNVISPCLLQELISEVADSPYSIILDESTDISDQKLIAYCILYYNPKLKNIVVDFLGFSKVIYTTAEALYEDFRNFISNVGLSLDKLIGIGTDGASSLCGKKNSLYTKLRERIIPNLILIKCICHSLHLCSMKAMVCIPSCIDFLIREAHNWFAHSALRWHAYEEIYKLNNSNSSPKKLPKVAATRWLLHENCIKNICDQWATLKQYFNVIKNDPKVRDEGVYKARLLADMFNDRRNYLYLLFLKSILQEVNTVNLEFQSSNAELLKLYDDLFKLLIQCARRIMQPKYLRSVDFESLKKALECSNNEFGSSFLNLVDIDYGDAFQVAVTASSNILKKDDISSVQERCRNFVKVLCDEMVARFPENMKTIEKLKIFLPTRCLSATRVRACDLSLELATEYVDQELIKSQWNKLASYSILDICQEEEEEINADEKTIPSVKFWHLVGEMSNAVGTKLFLELSNFVLMCLSLPTSNAVVERIFSIMNAVKSKSRNRLQLKAIDSIEENINHDDTSMNEDENEMNNLTEAIDDAVEIYNITFYADE